MGQKAKNGGTLGRASLGYLNVFERFDDRQIRTVALDPERAPLIRLAFELYATGDYTLADLSDELYDRGLRTRATALHPAQQVSISKLSLIWNTHKSSTAAATTSSAAYSIRLSSTSSI